MQSDCSFWDVIMIIMIIWVIFLMWYIFFNKLIIYIKKSKFINIYEKIINSKPLEANINCEFLLHKLMAICFELNYF